MLNFKHIKLFGEKKKLLEKKNQIGKMVVYCGNDVKM